MARIAGIDLPKDKRIEIGLTYIYGIGRKSAQDILAQTGINGDVLEGQAVAGLDVGRLAADDHIAHLQAIGSNDVALNAIGVLNQSDECAAVRIILESLDQRRFIYYIILFINLVYNIIIL